MRIFLMTPVGVVVTTRGRERVKFKDILDVNSKIFMHKYFNSQLPGSFNNMFITRTEGVYMLMVK